jgi:hypothetical protein
LGLWPRSTLLADVSAVMDTNLRSAPEIRAISLYRNGVADGLARGISGPAHREGSVWKQLWLGEQEVST